MPYRYLTSDEASKIVGRSSDWILDKLRECCSWQPGRPILIRQDTVTNLGLYAADQERNVLNVAEWCEYHGHNAPSIAYQKNNQRLTKRTIQRSRSAQNAAKPTAGDSAALNKKIADLQTEVRRLAKMIEEMTIAPPKRERIAEDSEHAKSRINAHIKRTVFRICGGKAANDADYAEAWLTLYGCFSKKFGPMGAEEHRSKMDNGTWIEAVAQAGFIGELEALVPDAMAQFEHEVALSHGRLF